jgi:hypothetical protein
MYPNKNFVYDPSKNEYGINRLKERFFILNHFRNYVSENAINENTRIQYPEYRTHIMIQVIEYTKGLFTLPQLYCMFMANKYDGKRWSYCVLNDLKMNVLNYIDEVAEHENDLSDIECFKKKVMELNPIIFNVLNDLIYYSQLFWDSEKEEFKYPTIDDVTEISNNKIINNEKTSVNA